MTRKNKTTTLGDALGKLVRSLGMEGRLEEQQAVDRWAQVVGDRIALHARAVFFEGGKLVVEVDSAAWRQELFYMKQEILNRLDRSFGKPLVQDIIFTNSRR
ncbi:MAG: DUF721 domain-containing protein [Gemmatimonadetes bacterium]|nr:DUF721 domain-containing protein [Gemmatimonadota bacterium]